MYIYLSQAKQVQSDLISAGFIINEEKSTWVPCQGLVWLGFYWNLAGAGNDVCPVDLHQKTLKA